MSHPLTSTKSIMTLKESFTPGLFAIGLNVPEMLSNRYLFIESVQLTRSLKIEPDYLKPAIRNMLAVLLFHMETGKKRAQLMLKKLIADNPKDLNALADLIYIYKTLGHERDSDKYKEQLELHKDDPLLQAKSILGQANALKYDLDDINNQPTASLKETWKLLNTKETHLEHVRNAKKLVTEAYTVVKTIFKTPYEKQIDAKEIAIKKFEKGINMLKELNCSQEEIWVWKFNLACALGQLDQWKYRRGYSTAPRSEMCIKEFEIYLDVIENLSPIENLEEPLKIYVAKAYIFFALNYCYRNGSLDQAKIPEKMKRQDLNAMFCKAKSIGQNDPMVLERCGRYQFFRKNVSEAMELYDKSICLFPDTDTNWFSYEKRSQLYVVLSKELIKNRGNEKKIIQYLKLAYDDIKLCLQSKCTVVSMLMMAAICFNRALPYYEWGIGFNCQDVDFIYEGLEIIHELLNKQDLTKDSGIYRALGKYYPYIGEYRKAIEFLKIALELNDWTVKYDDTTGFLILCKCFMALYKEGNDKNLLSEFRFMLKKAKKRSCDKWVSYAINNMYEQYPTFLNDLVENMIEWDVKGCENVIEDVFNKPACRNLKEKFERKLQNSDINGPTEIRKPLDTEEDSAYDFFVLHSEKEKEWVNSMLRPQLEDYGRMKFKGFIPSRDFLPGEKVVDSMLKGIGQSCKLLIVLTPNYIEDNWHQLVRDEILCSLIERKIQEKCIIPIILEECDIPDELKSFPPISFTKFIDWEHLRMSLTVNMDSETRLEERMSALTSS